MTIQPAAMRRDYDLARLGEEHALPDPFDQFAAWFGEALKAELVEPNAMALATATPDGRPSVRTVLLKGYDRRGFSFYTNYQSRKAEELAQNSRAALLFWWDRLHRQVRIEGSVEQVDPAESDAYFASRPYGSRIGAIASPQSRVIPNRAVLEERDAALRADYPADPPRPPHWGGYRLVPDSFEFWQGRPSRLHDRLRYTPAGTSWYIDRLGP